MQRARRANAYPDGPPHTAASSDHTANRPGDRAADARPADRAADRSGDRNTFRTNTNVCPAYAYGGPCHA